MSHSDSDPRDILATVTAKKKQYKKNTQQHKTMSKQQQGTKKNIDFDKSGSCSQLHDPFCHFYIVVPPPFPHHQYVPLLFDSVLPQTLFTSDRQSLLFKKVKNVSRRHRISLSTPFPAKHLTVAFIPLRYTTRVCETNDVSK